jgi:hypothetical protein
MSLVSPRSGTITSTCSAATLSRCPIGVLTPAIPSDVAQDRARRIVKGEARTAPRGSLFCCLNAFAPFAGGAFARHGFTLLVEHLLGLRQLALHVDGYPLRDGLRAALGEHG